MCKWVTIANIKSWCWKHCSLLPLLYSHAGTCCVTLYHQQQTPVHLLWKHVIKQGLITQTFLINSRKRLSLTGIEVIAGTISYIPCHRVVKRVKVETSRYPHMSNTDPESLKMHCKGWNYFLWMPIPLFLRLNQSLAMKVQIERRTFFGFVKLKLQGGFSHR